MELLTLEGVTKEFNGRAVLDTVDLHVSEGDVFGIIGRSGSGKSTLLNLIVGFYHPEKGKVHYHSSTGKKRGFSGHALQIKKRIGFTPQGLSFYPKLSVIENLLHFGRMYGVRDSVLLDNAKNLLAFTDLSPFKDHLAEELSGGMQKRLDIACSLIHKPKLLVLDEPVMNLDPRLKREVLHLIKEVNKQGITVVLASHDLESVEAICNKVAILHDGKVHSKGTMRELRRPFIHKESRIKIKTSDEWHEALVNFAKQLPISRIIDRDDHIVVETENFALTAGKLLAFTQQQDLGLNQVHISHPSLKTIFEKSTKK